MGLKLARRLAADMLGRGESSVRFKEGSLAEAQKAITREDVRRLITSGGIYAIPKKRNKSIHGLVLRMKRAGGRRRGRGSRSGSLKARGTVEHKKRVRGQRRVLAALKQSDVIDNEAFKKLYRLVKGGTFPSKVSLLNRIRSEGIKISDEQFEKLRHA